MFNLRHSGMMRNKSFAAVSPGPYDILMRDPGLQAAVTACGSVQALADRLGKFRQAVSRWRRVPAERVVDVERVSGVPREQLRPDLYRPTENEYASYREAERPQRDL